MTAAGLDRLASLIDSGAFRGVTSVVVSRRGTIVHERYHDDAGPDALRDTRSATKTVAGMLVGIAIERGELPGVDVPLWSLFEDLAPFADDGPAKRAVTIRHVLTMTSALDCDDADPDSPGNEERMYPTDDWLRFALDIPMSPSGGGSFSYCTAGVTALAGVLERATGRPLDAYAEDHLFRPLDIGTLRWTRAPSGLVQTGGGLALRSRDLLALGQLALDDGRVAGRRVLSRGWVRASTEPQVRIRDDLAYGYLWWLPALRFGGRVVHGALMRGNGGNAVAVLRELEAVAVVTSTNYNSPGMHEQTDRILVEHVLPFLAAG